jgi:hypothetical protein
MPATAAVENGARHRRQHRRKTDWTVDFGQTSPSGRRGPLVGGASVVKGVRAGAGEVPGSLGAVERGVRRAAPPTLVRQRPRVRRCRASGADLVGGVIRGRFRKRRGGGRRGYCRRISPAGRRQRPARSPPSVVDGADAARHRSPHPRPCGGRRPRRARLVDGLTLSPAFALTVAEARRGGCGGISPNWLPSAPAGHAHSPTTCSEAPPSPRTPFTR